MTEMLQHDLQEDGESRTSSSMKRKGCSLPGGPDPLKLPQEEQGYLKTLLV